MTQGNGGNLSASVGELGMLEERILNAGALTLQDINAQSLEATKKGALLGEFDAVDARAARGHKMWSAALWATGLGGAALTSLAFYALGRFMGAGTAALSLLTTSLAWGKYDIAKNEHSDTNKDAALARELREQSGFVFAQELTKVAILPSSVKEVGCAYLRVKKPADLFSYRVPMFAVKPETLTVPVVRLENIGEHINRPVTVMARVSSSPQAEDMKLSADANLVLSSYIFPGILFRGEATGSIDGKVYPEVTSFRISDGSRNSVAASMDFLPQPNSPVPPYVLRRLVPGFTPSLLCGRNDLVHFLREAEGNGRPHVFVGRIDPSGHFHVEAVGSPRTRETFALAVYQQPIELSSRSHAALPEAMTR